jgi:broad specificity phosphatase PhoE
LLIYLRHGKTSHNAGGSEERLRGWLPVPLTSEGVKQAHNAAAALGLRPDTAVTSDLPRAMQTADIVGKHLETPITPDPKIRDWNTGNLAGQKVTDVLPLLKHLVTHPDEPAPGGEPLNAYLARFVPEIKKRVADPGIHLVIGHARGASIIQGLASEVGGKGDDIAKEFLMKRPDVKPGGIMTVDPQWGIKIRNQDGSKPVAPGVESGSSRRP